MRYFIWGVIGFVAAAVIGAFFVIGSPAHQRLVRFDERRVSDLMYIQDRIVDHWRAKTALPATLSDLQDPIRGTSVPRDPETGAEYEYAVNAENTFTLCATFALESDSTMDEFSDPYHSALMGNWQHSAGHACFERTIDPDLYKPSPSAPRLLER